jgi:hypothetical protein
LFSRQLTFAGHQFSSVKLVELVVISPEVFLSVASSLEKGWITDGNIEKFDEVAEAVAGW